MSLDYRFGEIENFKKVCFQKGKMNPLSHALVFATIATGISEITKRNWIKFYARLHFWELIHGAYLSKDGKQVLISAEEVKRHIGLSTNASTLSEAEFLRNFSRKLKDIEQSAVATGSSENKRRMNANEATPQKRAKGGDKDALS